MRRLSLPLLILAVLPIACTTQSVQPAHPDLVDGTWPIADFDGFDPYPPGASGDINAYVNFARDGILRVSLGCEQAGAAYVIQDADTLAIESPTGISIADYSGADCSAELIAKEKSLVSFLSSQPKIGALARGGLVLKSGRKTLLLKSVADVLDEDTKMKVEL